MPDQIEESCFQPITGDRFSFRCHKNIECFTRCCADLNLLLTPYDILRLKNTLEISSVDFLDQFTVTKIDDRSRFPMVYLEMMDEDERRCPFLSLDGCRVYENRPGACRIYPLGRAASRPDGRNDSTERFFLVKEKHCLGFKEDRQWTIQEWLANEEVDQYNMMNDEWMEIITSPKDLGRVGDVPKKLQMFYMASYNLDKFREFLFQSGFFTRFDVKNTQKDLLYCDDNELMRFAFKWLKFSLFGENTIRIR